MDRTHDWAKRAKSFQEKKLFPMAVFGIVQGVTYQDLREESARFINSLDFDGNAIGGLAVGEKKEDMYKAIEYVVPHLSDQKPRYLMGVGWPEDILEAVERGVDMFDCVHPTRIARNGTVLTFGGRLNLNNAKYSEDAEPIEVGCDCYACQKFSKAYIRHLLSVDEVFGIRLTTLHNLRFMMRLMEGIREAIKNDGYLDFKKSFLEKYLKQC
jgi:queuine tRNA-ribosyltransferase